MTTIIKQDLRVSTALTYTDNVQIASGITVTVLPGGSIDLSGFELLNFGIVRLDGNSSNPAILKSGKYSTESTRGSLVSNFGLLDGVDVDGFFSNGRLELQNTVVKNSLIDALEATSIMDSLFLNSVVDIKIEPITVARSTFINSPIRAFAWPNLAPRSFESVNFLKSSTVFNLDPFFKGGSHAVTIKASYIDLAAGQTVDDRVFDADDTLSVLTNILSSSFSGVPYSNDPAGFRVGTELVSWDVLGYKQVTPSSTVQFSSVSGSANEGNSGTSTITVQAALSAVTTQTVTVPISYSGTAISGSDYTNTTTSITIAAGQTTGSASFSVIGDTTLEFNETVILTLGTPVNASLGTNSTFTHTVLNDDLDQQIVNRTNALTILVDKGVLGSAPVLLKDLIEEITTTGTIVTSHTVTYGTTKFKYSDIDALITTVIRNGEFTEEFRKEIVDQFPSFGGITYKDLEGFVRLIGTVSVDAIIMSVAGADGNFVG